jgi:phosphinothricin acetyltransferase
MTPEIKNATFNDLPFILEIVNHAILHTTSNYHYEIQTIEQQQDWFFEKIQKNFPIFVAMLENKIIGFGSYGTFREKIGYQNTVEHSVYVKNEFIGQGIGKILLQKLIDIAHQNNVHVMIGCIDADNKGSIVFHQKFGFKTVGVLPQVAFKFGRWLDLVIVQLIIKQ